LIDAETRNVAGPRVIGGGDVCDGQYDGEGSESLDEKTRT